MNGQVSFWLLFWIAYYGTCLLHLQPVRSMPYKTHDIGFNPRFFFLRESLYSTGTGNKSWDRKSPQNYESKLTSVRTQFAWQFDVIWPYHVYAGKEVQKKQLHCAVFMHLYTAAVLRTSDWQGTAYLSKKAKMVLLASSFWLVWLCSGLSDPLKNLQLRCQSAPNNTLNISIGLLSNSSGVYRCFFMYSRRFP